MGDFYTEQLVKKQTGMREIMLRAAMIAVGILGAALAVAIGFPFGMLLFIVAAVLVFLMYRKVNVEYEYLFVNGELDIDMIFNRARRKRVFSMQLNELQVLAPVGSIELKHYQKAKVTDYSSGRKDAKTYGMVILERGVHQMIIFEPKESIVEGFWMLAPRKVVRN